MKMSGRALGTKPSSFILHASSFQRHPTAVVAHAGLGRPVAKRKAERNAPPLSAFQPFSLSAFRAPLAHPCRHRLRREAEVFGDLLGGGGVAEGVDADDEGVVVHVLVPAAGTAGLDG